MIKFVFGLIVGAGLLLVAGYLYVTQGGLYMGTKGGPLRFERLIAGNAIDASIGKSSQDESPIQADETNLLAGAQIYKQNCAGCHGQFDQPASAFGKQLYPQPPQLLRPGKGVTDDPVGVTHWVVKNGIRFSAMPSYDGRLTDTELWQISLLLHNADKLPPSVQEALRSKQSD
jgi:mono/diheme cytochrome c family protein